MALRKPKQSVPVLLHLDDDLLVIDKPAGLPLCPPQPGAASALDVLSERLDGPLRTLLPIADGESGVGVLARGSAARESLLDDLAAEKLERITLAIVSGYVVGDGEVDLPLRFDPRTQRTRVDRARGKEALTRFAIVERIAGNTLIECRVATRIVDQVRVHMQAIRHPLTIDPVYGGGAQVLLSNYKARYRPSARRDERPLIDRLTLHTARVTLRHPTTAQEMTFESDIPKDFRATVAQLKRLA